MSPQHTRLTNEWVQDLTLFASELRRSASRSDAESRSARLLASSRSHESDEQCLLDEEIEMTEALDAATAVLERDSESRLDHMDDCARGASSSRTMKRNSLLLPVACNYHKSDLN